MSDANFSLIFEGPAVENGEIDVQDLAPSLMALGEMIQAANAGLKAPMSMPWHSVSFRSWTGCP
jgi:hypothetical protein